MAVERSGHAETMTACLASMGKTMPSSGLDAFDIVAQ